MKLAAVIKGTEDRDSADIIVDLSLSNKIKPKYIIDRSDINQVHISLELLRFCQGEHGEHSFIFSCPPIIMEQNPQVLINAVEFVALNGAGAFVVSDEKGVKMKHDYFLHKNWFKEKQNIFYPLGNNNTVTINVVGIDLNYPIISFLGKKIVYFRAYFNHGCGIELDQDTITIGEWKDEFITMHIKRRKIFWSDFVSKNASYIFPAASAAAVGKLLEPSHAESAYSL